MPGLATSGKGALRSLLQARRAARPHSSRAADASALADAALAQWPDPAALACYRSLPTEPSTEVLLDRLDTAGAVVWLPVVSGSDLAWARHDPDTPERRSGSLGLWEPAGPCRGPEVLARLDVVLVPALAVDREGTRLGRGRGYYDRALAALPELPRRPPIVAVVHDDELLDVVPGEPHDVAVDAALMPGRGLVWLGHAGTNRGVEG